MTFSSVKDMEDRGRFWQGVLNLSDWEIKFLICTPREMSDPENMGECRRNLIRKCATICLTDIKFYNDGPQWGERDQEIDLVHELLHVTMAPMVEACDFSNPLASLGEEWAVESIARALVSLHRANQ